LEQTHASGAYTGRNEHLEGTQTGFWQYAFSNETASFSANESSLGVLAAGLPMWPMVFQRISSGLMIIIFGRFVIAVLPFSLFLFSD
jgi:hypothetical protein